MISAVVLTLNNEKLIEKLIQNLKLVVGEIIIVDTGSNDDTVKIAEKLKCRVFHKKFNSNFSELRNFGINQAKGEWILSIDSDELLSLDLIKKIPELIKDQNIEGYFIGCKTYLTSQRYLKYGLFYPDRHLRLFKNKTDYKFGGNVHEQPNIPKSRTKDVELGIDILHFPQRPKYTKFSDFPNMYPYIRIQAQYLINTNQNPLWLIVNGIGEFIRLFFGGFFRGKGFQDGWAGLRAHLLFSASISGGYLLASYKILSKNASKK
jgi:glycosyltransferase involved in cell wall biosynthesis